MAVLDRLIESQFGITTYERNNVVVTQIPTTAGLIVRSHPDRVGLIIINNGTSNVWVKPSRDVALSNGIYIGPSGGAVTFDWSKDFSIISREWYGIASAAASDSYILEIMANPVKEGL